VLSAFVQPPAPGAPPPRRSTLALPLPVPPTPGNAYNKALSPSAPGPGNDYYADFAPTCYYISLQTNLSTTPVYRRNVWLAGLPDIADETASATIVDTPTWTAVKAFLNALSNGNYVGGISGNAAKNTVSIRSIDRSNGNPIKQVTAWNLAQNTYTVPAHGFVVGQPILAEGMKTFPSGSCPRGRYLVGAVIDANTIALEGSSSP